MKIVSVLVLSLLVSSCATHSKHISKISGCPENFQERVISESVTMKTSEITCGDRVIICKYSSFGFGRCKKPEVAFTDGWTKSSAD